MLKFTPRNFNIPEWPRDILIRNFCNSIVRQEGDIPMKQNIGIVGRYARLVTGILALNYAATAPRKSYLRRSMMASLGAMEVAEGVLGWCPTVELCNKLFFANQGQAQSGSGKNQSTQTMEKETARTTQTNHQEEGHLAKSGHHTSHINAKHKPELKLAETNTKSMDNEEPKHSDSSSEHEHEAF
jgi:hypothetical protein